MNELIATPAFQIWAVSASVLTANVIVLAGGNAAKRSGEQKCLNPEDKKLNPENEVIEVDAGAAARWNRAHRNSLENNPLFIITSLGFALTAPSAQVAAGLMGVFTLARLLHSFVYINGMQPWRTLSFAIGALTQLSLLGVMLYQIFA